MWSTSLVPPRTWHLSNVSTKHTNLPRSYPHVRVIGYEPPRSYHHMLTTIHEPTRSWHSISRSKCSIIAQTTHKINQEQQHFRLAQPTRRKAKSFQIAWRYQPTTSASDLPAPEAFCYWFWHTIGLTLWSRLLYGTLFTHVLVPDSNFPSTPTGFGFSITHHYHFNPFHWGSPTLM